MNPYVNHLAGFGAGFIGFWPRESTGISVSLIPTLFLRNVGKLLGR